MKGFETPPMYYIIGQHVYVCARLSLLHKKESATRMDPNDCKEECRVR